MEKVQSFFSKVTAQKEKSLQQSREIKACVCGSKKITILRLSISISRMLHGTALLPSRFFPSFFWVRLIMHIFPPEREPQICYTNDKDDIEKTKQNKKPESIVA